MDLTSKLKVLADAAKYDVSCSSSGSTRQNKTGSVGNAHVAGICHSWADDGRCISLLKILLSNDCMYNCAYCVNKVTNDIPRASFTPDEVAKLTIEFYRRNYIEGLFLSSAIFKSPNYTMELMIAAVKKLRNDYHFNGYIHLKSIPGADKILIAEAGSYVDRMSVNIELPSQKSLHLLAPQKKKEAIVGSMNFIGSQIVEKKEEKKRFRNAKSFVPAGQTTQLIVGATPEPDLKILSLSENLYQRYQMKRVYYSAYVPIVDHPNLPSVITTPPLLREHRLYQADWLLRFYGFTAGELLDEQEPNFDMAVDPKCNWALRNLHLFPIEVNTADYKMLLRIPGIGVKSARRIVSARKVFSLGYDDLKKIRVVLKRAQYFITCRGKYYGKVDMNDTLIRQCLTYESASNSPLAPQYEQLSFLSGNLGVRN